MSAKDQLDHLEEHVSALSESVNGLIKMRYRHDPQSTLDTLARSSIPESSKAEIRAMLGIKEEVMSDRPVDPLTPPEKPKGPKKEDR